MKKAGRKQLTLITSASVQGYVEPCGCTGDPKGGIARLAGLVDEANETFTTNDLLCHIEMRFRNLLRHGIGNDAHHPIIFRERALRIIADRHVRDGLFLVPL